MFKWVRKIKRLILREYHRYLMNKHNRIVIAIGNKKPFRKLEKDYQNYHKHYYYLNKLLFAAYKKYP